MARPFKRKLQRPRKELPTRRQPCRTTQRPRTSETSFTRTLQILGETITTLLPNELVSSITQQLQDRMAITRIRPDNKSVISATLMAHPLMGRSRERSNE